MLAGAPGLIRAVAECTQPHGPPATGENLKLLQKYLADSKCTDAVYRGLLQRAALEPHSEAVISKIMALFKQHLHRFPPSKDTLAELNTFCIEAPASLPLEAAELRKSIAYLKKNVVQLCGPELLLTRPSHRTSSMPGSPRHHSTVSESASGEFAVHKSRSFAFGVHHSSDGQLLKTHTDTYHSRNSSTSSINLPLPSQVPVLRWLPSNLQTKSVPEAMPEAEEPSCSTSFQSFLAATGQTAAAQTPCSFYSVEHSPHLAGLLKGVSPGAQIGVQHVLRDILDQDEAQLVEDVIQVSKARKHMDGDAGRGDGQQMQMRMSRQRLLFHPQLYSTRDALTFLSEQEVAAVVEAVCGPHAASSSPEAVAAGGVWGPGQERWLWQCAAGQPSMGQVCASILLKLIVDMWLANSPQVASTLTLRMLAKALRSPSPSTRARAFDVIYNLALQSCLLEGDQEHKQPEDFQAWLLQLLNDLMVLACMLGEQEAVVWEAALCCLLHLSTQRGELRRGPTACSTLHTKALTELMRQSLRLGWSQDIYSRLAHLLVARLVIIPEPDKQRGPKEAWLDKGLLDECGGTVELLHHFCRAGTNITRSNLLLPLLLALAPAGTSTSQLAPLVALLTQSHICAALQNALRYPTPGLAERLLPALAAALQDGAWPPPHAPPSMFPGAARTWPGDAPDADGTSAPDMNLLKELLVGLESTSLYFFKTSAGREVAKALGTTLGQVSRAASRSGAGSGSSRQSITLGWKTLREACNSSSLNTRRAAAHWLHQLIEVTWDKSLASQPVPHPATPVALSPRSPETKHVNLLMDVIKELLQDCHHGPEIFVEVIQRLVTSMRSRYAESPKGPSVPSSPRTPAPAASAAPAASSPGAAANDAAGTGDASAGASAIPPQADGSTGATTAAAVAEPAAAATANGNPRPAAAPSGGGPGGGAARPPPPSASAVPDARERSVQAVRAVLSIWHIAVLWLAQYVAAPSAEVLQQLAMGVLRMVCLPPEPSTSGLQLPEAFLAGNVALSAEVVGMLPVGCLVVLLQQLAALPQARLQGSRACHGRPGQLQEEGGGPPLGALLSPWSDDASNLHLVLLLLLAAVADAQPEAFSAASGRQLLQELMAVEDVRQQHIAGLQLQRSYMVDQPEVYWKALHAVLLRAQASDDEVLLTNPFVQMQAVLATQAAAS